MIAVLTPSTRPRPSSSGPPELPGLSGAVCWMTPSISRVACAQAAADGAEITPVDTVDSKPSGLPIATASWPGRSVSELPISTNGNADALARNTARSVAGSLPTTRASMRRPSLSVTMARLPTCSATWSFVSR